MTYCARGMGDLPVLNDGVSLTGNSSPSARLRRETYLPLISDASLLGGREIKVEWGRNGGIRRREIQYRGCAQG